VFDCIDDKPVSELKVQGVQKEVSDFVLAADFSVKPGQRSVLIGRSGSGKTTLIRLIAGLDSLSGARDQGRIWLGTKDMTELPAQKRKMGVLFQDLGLFPALNVLENVTFALKMQGFSREKREAEAFSWLQKVGLEKKIHSRIDRLSGGEAQRVALIRALIWKPRAFLLDEPFSALDRDLRNVLRSELLELHRLWPVPMILVSHDPEDLQQIATQQLRVVEESGFRRIQVE